MGVTAGQKAEAVRQVLESATFRRAEVLKTILEYLYQQESLGREHQVTESEVAINALGRGPEFAPELDSSVRTRVMALRKKLDEYYASEGQDAKVRLEIPRGTYALRFAPAAAAGDIPEQKPAAQRWRPFWAGAAVGAVVAVLAITLWTALHGQAPPSRGPNLAAVWGSMLERGGTVTVAVGTPPSFIVRDFGQAEEPVGDPDYRLPLPRDERMEKWYEHVRGRALGKTTLLHPSAHSPMWGDAAAATVVSRMLGEHGVRVEIVPGARVHAVALRDRNAVIIGRPEYCDSVEAFMPSGGLVVEYSAGNRMVGVHNRSPRNNEPEWWFANRGKGYNFGLVTVTAPDSGERKRTIIFSGINSDGAEAGARYVTSEEKLKELRAALQQAGRTEWPARFQIVVRTESQDTYSLRTKLEYLRVF